jgi:tRNA (mo5U34)-methyltransferase
MRTETLNTAQLLVSPDRAGTSLSPEIEALSPWFHNLHLPDGSQTAPNHPLGDFPSFKWRELSEHLPADLTGWSALDIGCNAGFYAIELAQRGAQVTAIDHDPHFLRQAEWAVRQFSLEKRIELRQAQIYDLARWPQRFDLVLFMGVFYHLRYPLLGLDIVSERVNRLLVFQTLTVPEEKIAETPPDIDFSDRAALNAPGWPRMAFIENKFAGDSTNWWAANEAGVAAMLRSSGMEIVGRPAHEVFLCRPRSLAGAASAREWDQQELRAATGCAERTEARTPTRFDDS